ncbi:MAG TPA: hypothetical protein VHC40_03870 [Rhizomicrobium sp.]|jgi:hypothetical protein|nr:hypothetical protein [Rhizomicrobium sp.]
MDTTNFETGPAKAASQLNDALVQMAECQRTLIQEMTQYARDETQRFVNLRMERNGAALDRLQSCHGISGLIGTQQEWMRDLLQDYIGQQLRLAGALRGIAQNAVATATEVASENIDRMQHEAAGMARQAGEQVSAMAQAVADGQSDYLQPTQH